MVTDKIKCACGREQKIVPADQSGGCTEEEAEFVGWIHALDAWVCPFCAGNADELRRIFTQGNDGE